MNVAILYAWLHIDFRVNARFLRPHRFPSLVCLSCSSMYLPGREIAVLECVLDFDSFIPDPHNISNLGFMAANHNFATAASFSLQNHGRWPRP